MAEIRQEIGPLRIDPRWREPDQDVPPNQTLFVNNISTKLKNREIRRNLYLLFSRYGAVVDINCNRARGSLGQAFIVFKDIAAATMALQSLQAFVFFNKPLRIQYAKAKSHILSVYKELDEEERVRMAEEESKILELVGTQQQEQERERQGDGLQQMMPQSAARDEVSDASSLLLVQNLPPQATQMMLGMLFQQFPGFREAKLVPSKEGVAIVEFSTGQQAAVAKNGLQNFKITPTHLMKITFADSEDQKK